MKRSFRIYYGVTDTKENTDKTVNILTRYIDCIDEIAIFESFSHHGFWGIEKTKERAAQLKYAISEFKKIGISSVGINVLCTIGHKDEGWDFLDKPNIGTVMGRNGEYSKSCLCINSPGYDEYITERYKIFSLINPDFIWVDDDFRYDNHQFPDVCYCPHCIFKYNEINGTSYTRTELVSLIESDKTEDKKWTDFRIKTLSELAAKIKNAIYSVNDKIEIGLMTCPGSDRSWGEFLDCKKLRPGAGFYNDYFPALAFKKPMYIGMQNQDFAGIANDIQYEFENFPYQELDKSDTIRRLECALALCFGCNGIAFNAMGNQNDVGIMRVVSSETAYWNKLIEICKNKRLAGIYCEASNLTENIELFFNVAQIGAPLCLNKNDATVNIYTSDSLSQKTDDELLNILAGNVLFDTAAFEEIQKRGFAEYCGCHTGKYFDNGMTERISDCEINGNSVGFNVNAFMNFWSAVPKICELIQSEGAHVLSNLETITGITGKPCMIAYENKLGGRVVVSSYFFITYSRFIKKREQLLNVFQWLSKNSIPIKINTPSRVVPILLRDDNEMLIVLTNLYFDIVKTLNLTVPNMAGKNIFVIEGDKEIHIGNVNCDNTIILNNLIPWHEVVLIIR